MGNEDDDQGGFPHDIFRQMQAGHEKFLRDIEAEGRRFQQEIEGRGGKSDAWSRPLSDSPPQNRSHEKGFFLSFKDFVDSSLGSLADSFKSLPSNIQDLRTAMQAEKGARKQDELDVWRRWTGIEDTPDHVQMLKERAAPEQRREAEESALMLLREAHARNKNVAPEKIHALYNDGEYFSDLDRFANPMLSPGGACYYQQDSGDNSPSTAIWRWGSASHRWLSIDWFKRSPYSPVNLEHHPLLQDSGNTWRAAFEDLLNTSLDKPISSIEEYGSRPNGSVQSTRTGPGLDWMLSLQCRGILPPQLPSLYQTRGVHPSESRSWLGNVLTDYFSHGAGLRSERARFALCHSPPLAKDVQHLIEEINTPAPEGKLDLADATPSYTELDLYQQPKGISEPIEKAVSGKVGNSERQGPNGTTGMELGNELEREWFREQQRCDAEDDLWDSLSKGDADAAARCIWDWQHNHKRRLGELTTSLNLDEVQAFLPTLIEALQRSDLPNAQRDGLAGRTRQELEALGLHDDDEGRQRSASGAQANGMTPQTTVDVLSSLTTTQTTRLPDGTVTTKVVLKQRFADGREEVEEKVHTYQQPPSAEAVEQQPERSEKKRGWFWT